MNIPTLIALIALTVIVGLVIVKIVRDKRRGKSGCACGCDSCPYGAGCGGQAPPPEGAGRS